MMQMAKLLFDQMFALFVTDPAGISAVLPPGMVYIGADFTPRPDLVLADLDIAPPGINVSYQAGLLASVVTFLTVDDPHAWQVAMSPGMFGWFVDCSGTTIPTTIFGRAFVSNLAADLYGVEKFNPAVTFSQAVQGKQFDNVIFTWPVSMLINA